MQAERVSGNYALLKYNEPSGGQRFVTAYAVENVVAPDIYAALTEQDSAARWCKAAAGPGGRLVLDLPDAPRAVTLIRSRPTDQVEFAVQHGGSAESTVTVTLAPASRCSVVTVTHRGVPAEEGDQWSRFWCGPVFLHLSDALQRGTASARPTIVKI